MKTTPDTRTPRHATAHGAPACFTPGERARRRMLRPGERPLFLADWTDVLFLHFAVDPSALQPHVPFALDLFRGKAYVSLVAFTQRNLRPRLGGRLAARLATPLATHEFLNVRTYVRHPGGRGIYFLAEWIPSRLAALVGPALYGLPYRLARMRYGPRAATGAVRSRAGRLAWRARADTTSDPGPARKGLEHFLLERYTAYTRRGNTALRFRVWHAPWRRVRARVSLRDTTLLRQGFPWHAGARPAGAHYSPGVFDVWIGPPRRAESPAKFQTASGNPSPPARTPSASRDVRFSSPRRGPSTPHFRTKKEEV